MHFPRGQSRRTGPRRLAGRRNAASNEQEAREQGRNQKRGNQYPAITLHHLIDHILLRIGPA